MQKGDSPTAVPTAPGRPRPYPFPRAIATAGIAQAAPRGKRKRQRQGSLRRHPLPAAAAPQRGQALGPGGRRPPYLARYHRHTRSALRALREPGGGRAGREEGTRAKHAHRSPRGLPRFPAGTCQGQQGPAAEPALGPGRPAATAGARPRRAAISLPAGCQAAAASRDRDRDRDAAPAGTQGPGSPRRSRTAAAHPSPSLGRQEGAGGCAAPHPFTPPGSRRRGAGFASRGPARPGLASPSARSRYRPRPQRPRAPGQASAWGGAGRGGALSHFPPPTPPLALPKGRGNGLSGRAAPARPFFPGGRYGSAWAGGAGSRAECPDVAGLPLSVCLCVCAPLSRSRPRACAVGGACGRGLATEGAAGPRDCGRAGGRAPGARGLAAVGPGQCCGAGREGADRCPAPA